MSELHLSDEGLDEEIARAEVYGLLAQLYQAPPAPDLLANLTQQQRFFATHLQPWADRLCDDLAAHPAARFYRAVAQFTRAFISVEAQGFDLTA